MSCCSSCKDDGPCESRATFRLVQADTESDSDIVVWGPISAEIVSTTGDLVRGEAVEKSLPMLLKRGSATLYHEDDQVGRLEPLTKIDWDRVPEDEAVRALVRTMEAEYGGLPSAVLEVTDEVVAAFPRTASLKGERLAFVGTRVLGGDKFGEEVKADIFQHVLDSYSLSGRPIRVEKRRHCDERGCIQVRDTKEIDLTSLTLCSSIPRRDTDVPGQAAANPAAGFIVVQQASVGSPLLQTGEDPLQRWIEVAGVTVGVEHPRGSTRTGTGPDGSWEREMLHHYGRILDTKGPDGEQLDVYVGPHLDSDQVFVVSQVDKEGAFDEYKFLLGFESLSEAVEAYQAHYPDDWRCGPVTTLTIDEFHGLLEKGMETLEQGWFLPALAGLVIGSALVSSPPESEQNEDTPSPGGTRNRQEGTINVKKTEAKTRMATTSPEQVTQMEPEDEAPMPEDEGSPDVVAELHRRVEALEAGIGEILARLGANDEAPAEDEAPSEEMPVEEADDGAEDEPEKTEEAASPGVTVTLTQAQLQETIKQAAEAAVRQMAPATAITPPQGAKATPTPATPPRHIETPSPSKPASLQQAADSEVDEAMKRLNSADPTAIRDLTRMLRA